MPTRYLKPGVRDSEAIDSLTPLAETLFYRLLVTVDDFGRYDGRPAMVKAHCFPIKDMTPAKCAALLDELHAAGLVQLYTTDGKPCLQMSKWDNVPRAKESKYPAPEDECTHLHTYASKPRTVLPLTETETGTETQTGNTNRKAPDGEPEVFPEGLDVRSWERWLAYRKEIGKALKPASIHSAQQAMVKYGDQQAAVVEQSIANGWQGLFALKAGHAKTSGESFYERDQRLKAEQVAQFAPGIAARQTIDHNQGGSDVTSIESD
jgi:hypothetical protein